MKFKTPYYMIHEQELDENFKKLKDALEKHWNNYIIGYSYKTNALPWVIKHFDLLGCYAETVSEDEYNLAKLIGVGKNHIIYNGPVKTKDSFMEALQNGCIVNIDSQREVEWLEDIESENRRIGIRINFDICNCATGLEIFRGMLIRKLVKEGNVVTAIVPQTNDKKEKDAEDGLKKMRCNLIRIPIERRGMNPFRDIQLFLEYYRTVKKIKPELVITYTIKPNIYGGLVCRLLKIPYVANITGLGTAFQNKGLLCHMVSGMYKLALKNAKVVFFENVENRDVIVKAKIIPKDQTYVLAGAGVDLEHFYYIEYPEETNLTKFLFIGRIMREKGIDELFSAMERLNNEGYKCSLDVLGGFLWRKK